MADRVRFVGREQQHGADDECRPDDGRPQGHEGDDEEVDGLRTTSGRVRLGPAGHDGDETTPISEAAMRMASSSTSEPASVPSPADPSKLEALPDPPTGVKGE